MTGQASAGWVRRAAAIGVLCLSVDAPVWAVHRTVNSKLYNLPSAPVVIRATTVTMIETFPAPTQLPTEEGAGSRVRYLNRKGLAPSQLFLAGETSVVNRSRQQIESVAVTVMPLDAFHRVLEPAGDQAEYSIHRMTEPLPRGATGAFSWEQPIDSEDIFEVAVVVTSVRFADGSVWMAPKENIIELFFR